MTVCPDSSAFHDLVKRLADKILADEVTRLSDALESAEARLRVLDPLNLTEPVGLSPGRQVAVFGRVVFPA